MLRERSSAPIFLYQGGSPFQLPDPTWIARFGGTQAVRLVSDGSLAAFVGLPDEGTLLREWSAPEVFRIMGGQRRWVPNPEELATYGGFPSVRTVPDGALAAIPQGPPTSTVALRRIARKCSMSTFISVTTATLPPPLVMIVLRPANTGSTLE